VRGYLHALEAEIQLTWESVASELRRAGCHVVMPPLNSFGPRKLDHQRTRRVLDREEAFDPQLLQRRVLRSTERRDRADAR
jgi:hypothetical protein